MIIRFVRVEHNLGTRVITSPDGSEYGIRIHLEESGVLKVFSEEGLWYWNASEWESVDARTQDPTCSHPAQPSTDP